MFGISCITSGYPASKYYVTSRGYQLAFDKPLHMGEVGQNDICPITYFLNDPRSPDVDFSY